ncbi:MAG: FHA domain-containing protein, partial [Victivallales bacterium]|nr:FHA domain-containing protein [Victivallales bacterium]
MAMNDESAKCYVKVYLQGQVPVVREITQFPCRIGRIEDNDIVIPESSVSSHHATLTEADGVVYLEDQWSTNGVYLDGNRIGHADVTHPIRIILGRVTADFSPTEEGLDALPPFAIPLPGPRQPESPQPSRTVVEAPPVPQPSGDEDLPQFQAVATTSRGKGVGKQGIVCPHCWHRFDVSEFLFIARHQSLTGDPVLGADAQQRFLPTRFTAEGNAIDAAGMSCPDMACPRCHLRIPQAASEMLPLFLSIVGAPAAGKSYFLTAMTWELRRTLPRNFAISFTDTDAVNNH